MDREQDLIRQTDDPIHWATFIQQLEDARVHLADLIAEMSVRGDIDEIDLGIRLGHIYGHINRAWNGRKLKNAETSDWYSEENCSFPSDLTIT